MCYVIPCSNDQQTVQNAIDDSVKPLVDKVKDQSEAIEDLQAEARQLKNENKSLSRTDNWLEQSFDDLEQHERRILFVFTKFHRPHNRCKILMTSIDHIFLRKLMIIKVNNLQIQ